MNEELRNADAVDASAKRRKTPRDPQRLAAARQRTAESAKRAIRAMGKILGPKHRKLILRRGRKEEMPSSEVFDAD